MAMIVWRACRAGDLAKNVTQLLFKVSLGPSHRKTWADPGRRPALAGEGGCAYLPRGFDDMTTLEYGIQALIIDMASNLTITVEALRRRIHERPPKDILSLPELLKYEDVLGPVPNHIGSTDKQHL